VRRAVVITWQLRGARLIVSFAVSAVRV